MSGYHRPSILLFVASALACVLSLAAYAAAASNPAPAGPGNLANAAPLNLPPGTSTADAPDASADLSVASATSFASPILAASIPISSGFDYPVGGALHHEGFEMNNCFGCAWNDWLGHTGEDFDNYRCGDPVYSVSEGVVVYRGLGPGAWGNVIIVQHLVRGRFIYSQYAHLETMNVVPGQIVGRRQQIGTVGTTGTVACHLHFEIKDQPRIGHGYTGWPFSGLTVYDDPINYWAPSWYIENTRHLDSPFGTIDGTRVIPGGFKLWGWALDPNTSDSIPVHVYLDRLGAAILTASDYRGDVGAAYPTLGSYHGYSSGITAAPGTHEACVYGINTGAGDNTQIECRTVTLTGNPIGGLRDLSLSGGSIQADGWAIDPDTSAPIGIHFYINGQFAGSSDAVLDDQSVLSSYPEYGAGHGFSALLPKFAGDNQVCAYGLNTSAGTNTLLGCETINVGLDQFPPAPAASGRHYYWPYFDGAGAYNWLLMASPSTGTQLNFDLNLQGRQLNLGLFGNPAVAPGETFFAGFRGIAGGPVVTTSTSGERAIVSQRILWGGRSLDEVPGTESGRLSDHFYWTWYDQQTPGFADWVMVANPGSSSIYYEITVAGQDPGAGSSGTVGPGALAAPAFPGIQGGPVELRAWTDSGKTTTATVMASQRVLSGYTTAFNEVPGIPASELSDHYLWTWYDSIGAAGRNWVMIANPAGGPAELYYSIRLGGAQEVACGGPVAQNGFAFWKNPDRRDGPVELNTFADANCTVLADSVASQRIIWGPSFEEVRGQPFETLLPENYWTWYDQQTPGALNWVMVTNPGAAPLYYQIRIGGGDPGAGSTGTLDPGRYAFPSFAGVIDGPVEVRAWLTNPDGTPDLSQPAPVLASQRVLWSGYFNEVLGQG
ncbi:MAG: M23 family metallopeptidase [Actinobacteria bacterium]|nr:M23 family metallopeptidase [Actinomycetota bacterium]